MNENISFTLDGWNEYTALQKEDKRSIKKINALIKDILRNGNTGIGHPEALKHGLQGFWSRTIDEKIVWFIRFLMDDK